MRAVYRYEIPVDDQRRTFILGGEVLAVGCRRADTVEFWAIFDPAVTQQRTFQVFGTGQPIPLGVVHRGTVIAPGDQLVWHLFELVMHDLIAQAGAS